MVSSAQIFQRINRRVALAFPQFLPFKKAWYVLNGARIGRRTLIPFSTKATWPHQLSLGTDCVLQPFVFFNYDHFWTPGPSLVFGDRVFVGRFCEFNIRAKLTVGDDCLIASGVKVIDHDHGMDLAMPMREQMGREQPVVIEDDVWIGGNAIILKGVTIGRGAVIGAGAVLSKPVGPYEIWTGVPATRKSVRRHG